MRKNGDGTLGIADATSYFRSCVAPDPEYDCVMSHPKKEGFMVVGHQEESGGFGIGQFVNDGASPKLTPDMDFLQASTELSDYQVGQHYAPTYYFRFVVGRVCDPWFWETGVDSSCPQKTLSIL